METVIHRDLPTETLPDLQLLREQERDDPRLWRTATAISGALHVALVIVLALLPASTFEMAPPPKPRVARRFTPLVAPRFEMTQKAPNKGPVNKELTAASIAPAPKVQSPAPGARRMMTAPPAPQIAKNTPAPVLPEPPKMEAQATPPTPQIQPPEKPKLAFEAPPPPPAGAGRVAAPGSAVQEAVRDLAHGGAKGGTSVGDSADLGGAGPGLNLPPSAGRPKSNLELKSDPLGVDFRPYLLQVLATVRRNWFSVYPESAKLGQRGKVSMLFSIGKDGTIVKVAYSEQSGVRALDFAAVSAISASNPLPPLPTEFRGDRVILQLTFLYNIPTR